METRYAEIVQKGPFIPYPIPVSISIALSQSKRSRRMMCASSQIKLQFHSEMSGNILCMCLHFIYIRPAQMRKKSYFYSGHTLELFLITKKGGTGDFFSELLLNSTGLIWLLEKVLGVVPNENRIFCGCELV